MISEWISITESRLPHIMENIYLDKGPFPCNGGDGKFTDIGKEKYCYPSFIASLVIYFEPSLHSEMQPAEAKVFNTIFNSHE